MGNKRGKRGKYGQLVAQHKTTVSTVQPIQENCARNSPQAFQVCTPISTSSSGEIGHGVDSVDPTSDDLLSGLTGLRQLRNSSAPGLSQLIEEDAAQSLMSLNPTDAASIEASLNNSTAGVEPTFDLSHPDARKRARIGETGRALVARALRTSQSSSSGTTF